MYVGILAVSALVILFIFSSDNKTTNQQTQTPIETATTSALMKKKYPNPSTLTIDTKKKYSALIKTSKGDVTVELFTNEAPNTVNNFVFLAREGFYDGTTFHRVVKDFMIQGGDPNGDGTGGPGYKFADEKVTRDYKRGIVAMANAGPNTNGSQFFIMHQDYDLPKNYTIFGQVTTGLDIIDKIAEIPTVEGMGGEKSKPTEKVTIEKVTINET